MKIYQSNSSIRAQKKRSLFIAIIVISIVILVLLNVTKTVFPKQLARMLSYPLIVLQSKNESTLDTVDTYFTAKQNLQNQIEIFRKKNEQLEGEKLQLLAYLNAAQQEEIEASFTVSGVVEEVLVRPPYTPYDSFIIKRTAEYEVGAHVYVHGVLFGTITETAQTTAVVTLFSQSQSATLVRVANFDTEAIGIGNGVALLTIPKDISVAIGTPVTTILNDTQVVVGSVVARDVDEVGSFAKLYVTAPIALQSVDYVTVVSN